MKPRSNIITITVIWILRLASSATNLSGAMGSSWGRGPRLDTSPRAIIWAMMEAGKVVVRIIAESPVAVSSLSTMS